MSVEAAKAGKDIWCEKPMTRTIGEGKRVMEAVKQYGRMFAGYGRQRGWGRGVSGNELPGNEDGFVELTEEECRQLELPKEWIA